MLCYFGRARQVGSGSAVFLAPGRLSASKPELTRLGTQSVTGWRGVGGREHGCWLRQSEFQWKGLYIRRCNGVVLGEGGGYLCHHVRG